MDHVLNIADSSIFTPYVYPASWSEEGALRQIVSLWLVTNLGAVLLFLGCGALNFYYVFDHKLMMHPLFLKNQVKQEIELSIISIFWMSFPTVAIFFWEVQGNSKLFDNISESSLGWPGVFLSIAGFLFFTDMCIYWIHRFLHHKSTYKAVYLSLFVFVNIWTISIHDGDYRIPGPLICLINGAAHHVDHHLFFNYNYGQYFTLWDRIGGSYRNPSALMGKGPQDHIAHTQ
ncbi:lathosterol oxidase-like isoform X2 [Notothenia coriiceps]|uniref:Lathosterol oxidase-like isoform X2 n=1 Tax=Notothenia coriiceps TaxID=8208 RepID=A0A6I9NMW2_9TELE|nr:PREDICTED: lathosterol oxidase-like isoform X2 [Notothenia coriiceps]